MAASAVLLPLASLAARSYSTPGYTLYMTGGPGPQTSEPPSRRTTEAANSRFRDASIGDASERERSASRAEKEGTGEARDGDGFTEVDLKNPPQMPSPQHYESYSEYLDAYDQYVQDTAQFSSSARVYMRRRLRHLQRAHAGVAEAVRREYFWTFVPFVVSLAAFMVDAQHHADAQLTHQLLKERTKQQVKGVKWEAV